MDHEFEPPDGDRLRTFAIATLIAMVVITIAVGSLVYAIAPEYGATAAYAIGAMVGLWVSPLPGGVASSAIHAHHGDEESPTSETEEAEPAHAA